MPKFEPVDRDGLTQLMMYECRNLAAVASSNVWMHFRRRVLNHVKSRCARLARDERGGLEPRGGEYHSRTLRGFYLHVVISLSPYTVYRFVV